MARANVGAPTGIEHLWQDNGFAYAGETGIIQPKYVCLEDARPQRPGVARAAYHDVKLGRIGGSSEFSREVWPPPLMGPKLFEKCPRCEASCVETAPGGISDLQTKGERDTRPERAQRLLTVAANRATLEPEEARRWHPVCLDRHICLHAPKYRRYLCSIDLFSYCCSNR